MKRAPPVLHGTDPQADDDTRPFPARSLLGAGLAVWLQSPWVLGTFAVLLALFALAMLDVFTLQAPVGLQSAMQARLQRLPGGRAGGVFVMGIGSLLIGVVFMYLWQWKAPPFFRGETLPRERT